MRSLREDVTGSDASQKVPRARVLLVDDDERNLLALSEVLGDIADIVSARSGEEALRHLLKHRFAVVILDVLMPGMDGYETARLVRAREQSRDTPIIFLTAINQEDAHTIRGYDLGAVDYVFKPFEPTMVRTKVSVFVNLHEKTLEIEHKARTEQRLLREKLDAQQERMLAVEALRVSEERQALILNALPMAVYVEDELGARQFVAGDVAAITGFETAVFSNDPSFWLERIHPEDRGRLNSAGTGSYEFRWLHADGGYRHFLDQSVALEDDGGALAGTIRDVSEQRLMQDQLLQAQKMDAVGKLTGGIAHDFNNLLASVLSGLALIERRTALEGKAKEVLEMTKHAAEQGKHLVSRLLTFSRRQNLAPTAVDLAAVARSLRTMLSPMLGGMTQLKWETDHALWPVYVDPSQLELAIMNLAINARDAMPSGGTITVNFANRTAEASEDLTAGDFVVVSVSDTGVGIAPDLLSKVLEPFFTTKDVGKGTGLGLSSAYGFARQSSGTLRIMSSLGEGTLVEIWLPRAHENGVALLEGATEVPVKVKGRRHARVLLVDDSPSLRGLTEMLLIEEGFSVTPVSGGAEALAILNHYKQGFDILVTDFAMPLMSGLEVIRGARSTRPEMPAVIITGYAETTALDDRPPDVPVVFKPFTAHALVEAIERVLEPS
ncbi:response regulator [Devosia sp.]|uniref:response regulator n=1 Tax=Devosia sp. TaxID=1871048 RepID=UPI002634FAC7|nr:response regulator [Devosia sp.]